MYITLTSLQSKHYILKFGLVTDVIDQGQNAACSISDSYFSP